MRFKHKTKVNLQTCRFCHHMGKNFYKLPEEAKMTCRHPMGYIMNGQDLIGFKTVKDNDSCGAFIKSAGQEKINNSEPIT